MNITIYGCFSEKKKILKRLRDICISKPFLLLIKRFFVYRLWNQFLLLAQKEEHSEQDEQAAGNLPWTRCSFNNKTARIVAPTGSPKILIEIVVALT